MNKVLFLPLANKNFISSYDLSNIIIKKFKNNNSLISYPFSDGGEDSDVIFNKKFNFRKKYNYVYDFSLKKKKIFFYEKGNQIFIPAKNIVGGKKRYIKTLNYSSYGIGQIIKKNLDKKFFFISLGGSINTDAGLGLMQALGVKFIFKNNKKYQQLLRGKNLKDIKEVYIDRKIKKILKKKKVFLLSDSDVYPYGKKGQSYIFGKQKGMKNIQILKHDQNINNFCKILSKKKNFFYKKYLGAGGAIGVGLSYLFNVKIYNGSEFFYKKLKIEKLFEKYSIKLLISSEGRFDKTSLFGKGFRYLENIALKKKIRFLFIIGKKTFNYKKKNVIFKKLKIPKLNKNLFSIKLTNIIENVISKYQ